jgi:hypothetical protein
MASPGACQAIPIPAFLNFLTNQIVFVKKQPQLNKEEPL